VSPALFRAIAAQARTEPAPLLSVHVAESAEEERFLMDGQGAWRDLLERVGAWTPDWTVPRCSPVRYLERLGWLDAGTLLVHAVHVTPAELEGIAAAGATIVTCPRSNARLRVGTPPVADFLASGVNLAVGTDSLASSSDLNVFQELAALRRLVPDAPAARLLACATANGARALRLHGELGTLEVGKRARAVAVTVDAEAAGVEEQLLRGVEPGDLQWVAA
jgi:cytosine/adenosine deaminase-related metal-dependent hydrolase